MSDAIAVAVCTRPGAPLLGDCLEALARAGVTAPVIATAAAGHGLAVARNDALDRSGGAQVIAYVDDDVLVPPAWLDALAAAWAAAPASVAVIGGPLDITVRGTRRAWLSDELLAALIATAPAGSGAFDPAQRTLPAGNLACRTAALRGVGGFWPARGRAGARDWFTEEHEVQRELGRGGWELRQDDALAAQRVIDGDRTDIPRVIAARASSGAHSAAVGARRSRHAALAVLGRSAAGAALAAGRRDSSLALQRAARVAYSAGELAGAAAAHADLQPVANRTPFRHTIAPAQPGLLRAGLGRLAGGRRGAEPLVLALHRVADAASDPLGLALPPARFAALLEHLREERTPVPLDAIASGDAPADAVAITLDDGYLDSLTHALPLLEAKRVPATVFVSTGHIEDRRPFWWDELDRLLHDARPAAAADPLRVVLRGDDRAWPAGNRHERSVAARHLFAWLPAHLPEEIDAVLDAVAAWARVPRGIDDADRALTVSELRCLAASSLITIGSHARTHPNLAFAPPGRRAEELRRSREDLERWLGTAPSAFAYPFGVWGTDVDAATRDAVADAGYAYAVTNDLDVPYGDRYLIGRVPAAAYAERRGLRRRLPG